MRTRMVRTAGALFTALVPVAAMPADLDISQEVIAKFSVLDAQGHLNLVTQVKDETPVFGPTLTPVSAFVGGRSYSATARADATGVYGLAGEQYTAGVLGTFYSLMAIGLVNDTTLPVQVHANFIITGGRLRMLADTGSRLDYILRITDLASPFYTFESSGTLLAVDSFEHLQFTTSGTDIGAHLVDNPSGLDYVDLPFGQQDIDLGVLPPGESLDFKYSMEIHSELGATEIADWRFQDPFNLASGGTAPMQFTLIPIGPTVDVPAPAGLPLLLAGLAGWSMLPRRRS